MQTTTTRRLNRLLTAAAIACAYALAVPAYAQNDRQIVNVTIENALRDFICLYLHLK